MVSQKIYRKLKGMFMQYDYSRSKKNNYLYSKEFVLTEINKEYDSLNEKYNYFHHYFWNKSPHWLIEHREYFKTDFRGFGEDAFHAMWYFIFKEYSPKKALEIGIYRGQVISLWGLISEKLNLNSNISGISPFSPAGDQVSVYLKNIDYYEDVIKNCSQFNKKLPQLYRGYSTDKEMIAKIESEKWDLIYIDGNHDYEIVKKDFEICSNSLNKNGLIVLDDSSLYTGFKPKSYATAGHPGPSKLAQEIDLSNFEEILAVGHNRVFKKIV
ncbi:MAG: class I SAM-dependent methyltransferase [Bacteroidota bacterium]